MDAKEAELARAKRNATLALVAAAAAFLLTLAAPETWWVRCIRMVSEAAMVGGLADWFAVAALFRRIPSGFTVPYLTAHTAVIPRSKDRIAASLSGFVKEKYLDADSLADLIRRNDLAQRLADWLQHEENTERLTQFLLKLVRGTLDWVEAERFQVLLKAAARTVISKADLSGAAGAVLHTLTAGGRHQHLLDQVIVRLMAKLEEPGTREFIAERIVQWLREGPSWKRRLMPAEWIGDRGAQLVAANLASLLDEVRRDQGHRLRIAFDQQIARLVERLKSDPELLARGEQVKEWLLEDEAMGEYVNALWAQLSAWIRRDLEREDSAMHRNIKAGAAWLGRQLATDADLRRMVNLRLEEGARGAAADFADFLTEHIRETTRQWNAEDLSRQVELNIGKELQAIRLNGTAMGGAIGFLLFAVTQLSQWLRA